MRKLNILKVAAVSLFAMALTQAVHAQTATDLNCNGCVNPGDIANGAVNTNKLKNFAVSAGKLQNGAVNINKLKSNARPGYANNAYTLGSLTAALNGNTVAQTLNVTVASAGHLVVWATWNFGFNANEDAECAITLNSAIYNTQFSNESSSDTNFFEIAASTTGVFTPVSAGNHTLRLICRSTQGLATVRRRSLTALFVPNLF